MKATALSRKILAIRAQAQAILELTADVLEELQPEVQKERAAAEAGGDGGDDRPVRRTFGGGRQDGT